MEFVSIKKKGKTPKLTNPLLIEGLPGIGNVGKLAVEHLIDTINAKKFAEIYSKDFHRKFSLIQMELLNL